MLTFTFLIFYILCLFIFDQSGQRCINSFFIFFIELTFGFTGLSSFIFTFQSRVMCIKCVIFKEPSPLWSSDRMMFSLKTHKSLQKNYSNVLQFSDMVKRINRPQIASVLFFCFTFSHIIWYDMIQGCILQVFCDFPHQSHTENYFPSPGKHVHLILLTFPFPT